MAEVKFTCPECGAVLAGDEDDCGIKVACPECETRFITPEKPPRERPSSRAASSRRDRRGRRGEDAEDVEDDEDDDEGGSSRRRGSAGSERTRKAVSQGREAVDSIWRAFLDWIKDPVYGQDELLKSLGPSRAMQAGIGFGVIFVLLTWLSMASTIGALAANFSAMAGEEISLGIMDHLKLILTGIAIFGALFGCLMVYKSALGAKGELADYLFVTGIVLLPFGLLELLAWLLGLPGARITSLLGVFVLTTSVLMLNAALVDVLKMDRRRAVIFVPVTFVTVVLVVYILARIGLVG